MRDKRAGESENSEVIENGFNVMCAIPLTPRKSAGNH